MIEPVQAAKLARVSQRTIYRWVEGGKVHFLELPGGELLICLNSLGAHVRGAGFTADPG